jgi:drug/metabolite transporter (DMT)-like permease
VLAGVCTVYAFSSSVELMKRLSAFVVNLTINLEPVYGILLAVLIFGNEEKMSLGFYLGTVVILFSVLIHPVLDQWNQRREKKQSTSADVLVS